MPVEEPECSGSPHLAPSTYTVADLHTLHVEEGELAAALSYYFYNELESKGFYECLLRPFR